MVLPGNARTKSPIPSSKFQVPRLSGAACLMLWSEAMARRGAPRSLLFAAAVTCLPCALHARGKPLDRVALPAHASRLSTSGCGDVDTSGVVDVTGGGGATVEPAVVAMDLGGTMWELSNTDGSIVVPGEVPGVVHLDLLRAGRVPEPYFR